MEDSLEERIHRIEARNRLVELNKRWETSWMRRVCISILTYFVVVAYSWWIGASQPWIQALVPVMGFLLSTLTISAVKHRWMEGQLMPSKE